MISDFTKTYDEQLSLAMNSCIDLAAQLHLDFYPDFHLVIQRAFSLGWNAGFNRAKEVIDHATNMNRNTVAPDLTPFMNGPSWPNKENEK